MLIYRKKQIMNSFWNFSFRSVCVVLVILHVVKPLSYNISEYILIQENSFWNKTQRSFQVRSVLECSKQCSKLQHVCGFNYIREAVSDIMLFKTCHCIIQSDLVVTAGHTFTNGSVVYVKDNCMDIYQAAVSLTSTTSTISSSTTLSSTDSTTPTITTTTAQILTTSTAATSTSSALPSTTASSSTVTTTSSAAPTTTTLTTTSTTSAALTTTSIAATTTSSAAPTTTSTYLTTTRGPCSSTVDALICTSDSVYVFINDKVHIYTGFNALTNGPDQVQDITNMFPEASYPLVAGYTDGSYIHLIRGETVWKYRDDSLTYTATVTSTSLFGSDGDSNGDSDDTSSDYDAILYLAGSSSTYLFKETSLSIVENGNLVNTVSLSNNGNKNPYKSKNYNNRPTQIVAASSIDADRHVFISGGDVYLFTFSTKQWTNLGVFIC